MGKRKGVFQIMSELEPKPYARPARVGMDAWPSYREPEATPTGNVLNPAVTPEIIDEGTPSIEVVDEYEPVTNGTDVSVEVTSAANQLIASRTIGGQQHEEAMATLTDVLANRPGAIEELLRRQNG